MLHRTRLAVALALLAALVAAPSAFARGGNPGGGTTSSYGAIDRVSGAAACDGGSSIGIRLDKGANKQIDGTITMVGGTSADGTSTLYGSWSVMLFNDTTAKSLGGFAGSSFGPTVPSVLITNLFGGVPAGSYDITLTATKYAFGSAYPYTGPALETCVAHFFVTAR